MRCQYEVKSKYVFPITKSFCFPQITNIIIKIYREFDKEIVLTARDCRKKIIRKL